MSDALLKAIRQKPKPETEPALERLDAIASTSTGSSSSTRPTMQSGPESGPEPQDLGQDVNFDLDFEMDWFDSQTSEVSVSKEEIVHNEQVTNVLEPETQSQSQTDNISTRLVTNRSTRTTNRSTTMSSTTTRNRRQTMMSPFVFQKCNVTINYFNSK